MQVDFGGCVLSNAWGGPAGKVAENGWKSNFPHSSRKPFRVCLTAPFYRLRADKSGADKPIATLGKNPLRNLQSLPFRVIFTLPSNLFQRGLPQYFCPV